MKTHLLVAALAASLAFVASADAATKKQKKVYRAGAGAALQAPGVAHSHDVFYAGERVGRDPDLHIRSFMIRNPYIWDGPE